MNDDTYFGIKVFGAGVLGLGGCGVLGLVLENLFSLPLSTGVFALIAVCLLIYLIWWFGLVIIWAFEEVTTE